MGTLTEDEKRILAYLQRHPFLEGAKDRVYKHIGHETGISSIRTEEIARSFQKKRLVSLSTLTVYNPDTEGSEDFIVIEMSNDVHSKYPEIIGQKFVKCPHCDSIYSVGRLPAHILRKHTDTAWRRERGRKLVRRRQLRAERAERARAEAAQRRAQLKETCKCPYCSEMVRSDRLSGHIEWVHSGSTSLESLEGERTRYLSAGELNAELLRFLENGHYETEGFGNYIVARHRERSKIYLISARGKLLSGIYSSSSL